jgi:hypothetical protein
MISHDLLNKALTQYLGYMKNPYPHECKECIKEQYGDKVGKELIEKIEEIIHVLDQLKPDWNLLSFEDSVNWSKEQIHQLYPELNNDSLNALAWLFTWWWR